MNWESRFTAKVMSGLVRPRYYSAPITLLYYVLSAGAEPSVRISGVLVDIGV